MLDNNLPSSKSGLEAEIKWYNLGRHRQSSVCDVVHKSVRHNNSSLSNVTSQKKVVWVFPNRKLILTLALVLNYLCSSGIVLVSGAPSAPMINAIHNRVPVGAIVHLFPRYGYLSLRWVNKVALRMACRLLLITIYIFQHESCSKKWFSILGVSRTRS